MITLNQTKFAERFNAKFLCACRRITPEDVHLMTECGLIGKYSYYICEDLETTRGILRYEQLRENRSEQQIKEPKTQCCKRCSQPLIIVAPDKKGRHKEYCCDCEIHRNRDRQKKLRLQIRKL